MSLLNRVYATLAEGFLWPHAWRVAQPEPSQQELSPSLWRTPALRPQTNAAPLASPAGVRETRVAA